jgi:hypothetical protein
MKVSRHWATPLTIGAFGLMSVTGLLMFFHWNTGLNKTAHEWLGWLMVIGVVAHAAANWPAFKRYFLDSPRGKLLLGASLFVTCATFIPLPESGGANLPPPVMAMKAVTRAPVATVAALSGRPVDQVIAQLGSVGIKVPHPDATLDGVIGGNRELEAAAMRAIFGK